LRVSDKLLVREWRCGEGFAAQNSATLIVGLGGSERVDLLTVIWPSGRRQEIRGVEAGRLITAYEDPQRAPGGEGFVEQAYTVEPAGD
jgi:hypothetical protein